MPKPKFLNLKDEDVLKIVLGAALGYFIGATFDPSKIKEIANALREGKEVHVNLKDQSVDIREVNSE